MQDSQNGRLARNTIMLYVMTIGKYVLPLITLPYLTRILTPEYYGVVTYMTSTMNYFQVLVDFGFLYSSTREASLNRCDKQALGEILSSTICAKVLLSGIGAVILVLMIPFVKILRTHITLAALYYISVAVTIFLPDYIYRGLEKMEIVSGRFILARVVSAVLTFALIRSPDDILLVPVLTICGNLVAVIFSFLHLYKKEKIYLVRTSIKKIITALKQSSVFFIATFATTAFGATTTFLMGIVDVSSDQIAYWNLAYQIVSTIQMLYDPIISSLYPHMVKEKDYSLVKKIVVYLMPIVIVGTLVCYYFAEAAIRIVGGAEYMDAVPVFRYLLPMLIFSFPAQLLGFPVLASMGKEKWGTVSTVISAIFHVGGLFVLIGIGKFDIIHVAVLRSCTDGVLLVSRLLIFKRIVFLR